MSSGVCRSQGVSFVRFRSNQRPRGILRPSDQRRLTLAVAGLGLVLLCFNVVRRPQFWQGLFPETAASESAATTNRSNNPTATPAETSRLRPDEVLITNSGADNSSTSTNTSDNPVDVTVRKIPMAETGAVPPTDPATGLPQIPTELLNTVRDDVIGVHSGETEAYYAALKMAGGLTTAEAARAMPGAFALFMDSPEHARGTAYRMAGKLRQLSIVQRRASVFGFNGAATYDAWVTTADSGNQLVHVVTSAADESLVQLIPPANKQKAIRFTGNDAPDVRFTGYFFKREGYASHQKDGLSIAPLFLTGTLHDNRQPPVTSTRADHITPYLGWLAAIVAVGILLMVWNFSVSDAAHARTRAHQLTRLPAHATFDNVTAMTVGESLGQLEVQSQASESSSPAE